MVRSIKGKQVDMGRLAAENRNTVAVGNMQVNAAGDSIVRGAVKDTATQQAKFFYKTMATKVVENVSLKTSPEELTPAAESNISQTKGNKRHKEIVEDNGDIIIDKE